jgi:Zn-dependent M28 family amino/carboxypeptidase
MRKLISHGLACLALAAVFNCAGDPVAGRALEQIAIDTLSIDRHLRILSSDEFMGRKPFTEGETKTLAYLEAELRAMGLQGANNGSFLQKVPLVEISPQVDPIMRVKAPGKNIDLRLRDDFVLYSQREQEDIRVEDAELVFCGYGIVAPEYNWNDYEGVDMKGKIALVLVNDPGYDTQDSLLFKGNIMTYYGRWTYKYEEAARQGAAGVLIVHQTGAAGYPWFVAQGFMAPRLNLRTPNSGMDKCAFQGWLTLSAAAELMRASPVKDVKFFEVARQPGFKPIPLGLRASVGLKNTFKRADSHNVAAVLPGSERPDETIVYTAHWDHLGVGVPVAGDSIYNGAVDNASGAAALLAIAEAFSKLKNKPQRSVVFLFVTAEEQGLLGSEYYSENPLFPIDKTAANFNMDALNPNGRMRDLTVIGYGQSELDDYAREEAARQGRYIIPDQEPEKGFYFRSDHFNFARVGVPALYASGSYDHWEKGMDHGRAKSDEYIAQRYHQPSDEYLPELWELSGVEQDAQLFFNIGLRLANERHFPDWREGSEFKGIRDGEVLGDIH